MLRTYILEQGMRFMVLVKATHNSKAGVLPTEQMFAEMGRFNAESVDEGVMEAGEGLHPSSMGARVHFSGTSRVVVDGPFTDTNELVAGFWLWRSDTLREAIAWVKRCPNPMPGESDIEIRQIYSAEDFDEVLTPDLRAQEDDLRAQVAIKTK